MLRKNRYAFATKFDLCAFGCFALSVEKIRIKFDLCAFGRGIGFCTKTAFVILLWTFVINIKCTRLIKFALIAIAG